MKLGGNRPPGDNPRDIFIRVARGHCPPRGALPRGHCQGGIALNFDNPKRSKISNVACGKIIRRVVTAAYAKRSVIDFWICFKHFLDVL